MKSLFTLIFMISIALNIANYFFDMPDHFFAGCSSVSLFFSCLSSYYLGQTAALRRYPHRRIRLDDHPYDRMATIFNVNPTNGKEAKQ
jgi:hypothetical protein